MDLDKHLRSLREQIQEIEPAAALDMLKQDALLIDIRETEEQSNGIAEGAVAVPRGFLEIQLESMLDFAGQSVLLICEGGTRSLMAADALKRLGYEQVFSVKGGMQAWKAAGLAISIPQQLSEAQKKRYARHLRMPQVGAEGQLKLLSKRVLVVGAGGLGSPSLLYLAATGVGTIGIVDHDVVDESNLQRQIIHGMDTVGTAKAESARRRLEGLNPDVQIICHQLRLDKENVLEIMADYDVVLDGTDNYTARYLINDAAMSLGIPVVHAAIYQFDGYITVFGELDGKSVCYRCVYPEPPSAELAGSCSDAGVLGVLPGVMGCLQAVETIKLLLGIGTSLHGRMLLFDALDGEFRELALEPDAHCSSCGQSAHAPLKLVEYQQHCTLAG